MKTDKIEMQMPDGSKVIFYGCEGPEEVPTETYRAAIAYPIGAAPHATNFWQTIQVTLTTGFDENRVISAIYLMDQILSADLA